MQANKQSGRIHPLIAGAAASVMLVCLVGTAAITGILPTSHGSVASAPVSATTANTATVEPVKAAPVPAIAEEQSQRPVVVHHHAVHHTAAPQYVAQAPAYQQPSPVVAPAPAPVAQNSPVGIGVGAVVGGLLGSQVGGGRGRTLSTIAGAIGGGYVGNEIAKRNQ